MKTASSKLVLLITAFSISLLSLSVADDAPSFRYDQSRSGTTSEVFPPDTLSAVDYDGDGTGDRLKVRGRIYSSPVVVNHHAYVATYNGNVYSFNLSKGTVEWKRSLEGGVTAPLAWYKGKLLVPSVDKLIAFYTSGTDADGNSRAGKEAFHVVYDGISNASPLILPGEITQDGKAKFLFSTNFSKGISAFKFKENQSRIWEHVQGGLLNSSAAYANNQVVVGTGNGVLLSLDESSGSRNWEGTASGFGSAFKNTPVFYDLGEKLLYFTGGINNDVEQRINVIDGDTGDRMYSHTFSFSKEIATGSPSVSGNHILVNLVYHKGYLWRKDAIFATYYFTDTGSELQKEWSVSKTYGHNQIPGTFYVPSPTIDGSGNLYTPLTDRLIVRDSSDGSAVNSWELPKKQDGSIRKIVGTPKYSNGQVLIPTYNGSLYVLNTGNTAPPSPKNLSPADGEIVGGTKQPELNWDSVSDPDEETVEYEVQANWSNTSLDEHTDLQKIISETSYTITDDLPDKAHVRWRVRAIDPNGANSMWVKEDFWLQRDTEPPAPPEDFTASPRRLSAHLSWTHSPSSDVTNYGITYRRRDGGNWNEMTVGYVDQTTVENLKNGVSYEFELQAIDDAGNRSDPISDVIVPKADVALGKGGARNSIQSAIDAAAANGGVVHLSARTFRIRETLNLHSGVSLIGHGPGFTVLKGINVSPVVSIEGEKGDSSFRIAKMTVTGKHSGPGIQISGPADVQADHLILTGLKGPKGTGLQIREEPTVESFNNTFARNRLDGVENHSENVSFRNNIYLSNGSYGFENLSSKKVKLEYFSAYGNNGDSSHFRLNRSSNFKNIELGKNFLPTPPVFKNPLDKKFRVENKAITVDQGDPSDSVNNERKPHGDRVNIGAYGGTKWAAKSSMSNTSNRTQTFSSPSSSSQGNNRKKNKKKQNAKPKKKVYQGTKTVNKQKKPVDFKAIPGKKSVSLSWRVPFPEDEFQASSNLFFSRVFYKKQSNKKYRKKNVNKVSIDNPKSSDVFYVSGETTLNGLKNRKSYEVVLYVYYRSGVSAEVVDPVSLSFVPGVTGSSDATQGCFIATAAWGTDTEEMVFELRTFRDRMLRHFDFGTSQVRKYYRTAPPVAEKVEESILLKRLTRRMLDVPQSPQSMPETDK